ncbi:hypothetical protein TRVL_03051 [Trypanosoma vivax]|nr:hypothetical protein TRVL_03051 [Trypanosoma vivax]
MYLKRPGNRGIRMHEADILQHYPGYKHPLHQEPDSLGYISEANRLFPGLKYVHEQQQERAEALERNVRVVETHRQRHIQREADLLGRREKSFARMKLHKEGVVGLSMRNEPGDGRDTITQECRSAEARQFHDYKLAQGAHVYYTRQQRMARMNNKHDYNILTGEPIKQVAPPPFPGPLPDNIVFPFHASNITRQ